MSAPPVVKYGGINKKLSSTFLPMRSLNKARTSSASLNVKRLRLAVIAIARLTFANMPPDSGVLLGIILVRSSFAIRYSASRTASSWTLEESKVESCEHQDNANIHCQSFPESVSEEHQIYTDYDGCHRHRVKHPSYLSAHLSQPSPEERILAFF